MQGGKEGCAGAGGDGFTEKEAKAALQFAGGDLHAALDVLQQKGDFLKPVVYF